MTISIIFYVNQMLRTQNTYERRDVAMLLDKKKTILTRRVAIKITYFWPQSWHVEWPSKDCRNKWGCNMFREMRTAAISDAI